jgi:hypothetical protein
MNPLKSQESLQEEHATGKSSMTTKRGLATPVPPSQPKKHSAFKQRAEYALSLGRCRG